MTGRFKGSEPAVSHIEIVGRGPATTIRFTIQFRDSDGIVHASTRHEVEPQITPAVRAAAKDLTQALVDWATAQHFEDAVTPSRRKKAETKRGIAEALQGQPNPADDLEGQG